MNQRRSFVAAVGLLAACSSPQGDGSMDAGGVGAAGAMAGSAGAAGNAAGGSGAAGHGGSMDAGVTPPSDASGAQSETAPPHYADGGIQAVAATPPAMWVNVTANLPGMPSECGNTPYLASHPAYDMLI